ncbi:hypothetical protein AALP_AA5G052000 [Arabis alpina]|uniref:Uncharacterized protein n=1 Tax=Arabis alpina TaxID=50452 RepID=A0A087GV25_ARAAL|nr:hypothetical protein AALP_AA5G052000 [Arabis alpina]
MMEGQIAQVAPVTLTCPMQQCSTRHPCFSTLVTPRNLQHCFEARRIKTRLAVFLPVHWASRSRSRAEQMEA